MIRSRDSDAMSPNRPARWKLVVLNQRPSWSRLTGGSVRLPPGLPRLDCAGERARLYRAAWGSPVAGRRRGDVLRRLGPSTWDEFLYCRRLDLDSGELFLRAKTRAHHRSNVPRETTTPAPEHNRGDC